MLLSYLILAISVSIDSLGIGITYGLRNTIISKSAKFILFFVSIMITTISVTIGATLNQILPPFMTTFIGAFFLILMGLWIIYQALNKKENSSTILKKEFIEPKVYQFFIHFLGITIQIIRDPISSDQDHSQKIDWKEAIYLGIALSIDSLCIGICSSTLGFTSYLFPIFVAIFQLLFLSFGRFLGSKISTISRIPENIWSILSGLLLICIGTSRFFL